MPIPTACLDQNALIYLYMDAVKDADFKRRLVETTSQGKLKIVLSPWHWVETARTKDIHKAGELADFMDSLDPLWLRERRDLQKQEVTAAFLKFLKVEYAPPSCLLDRGAILAEINSTRVGQGKAPSSRQFVEGWITRPELMGPIERSHAQNAEALASLRKARTAGKLTSAIRNEADRKLIEGLLPERTPSGVIVGREVRAEFLKGATLKMFPSVAIESAIAEFSWAGQGKADWNSMMDKFHLISALPYVDVVVSDDKYFYTLLPVAQSTDFVKARVMKYAEFRAEFLP